MNEMINLLGKLSSHAPNLDDGHRPTKGQDQGHLQEHTEGVTDGIDMELLEALCAVSTHQEESLTHGGFGCFVVWDCVRVCERFVTVN